MNTNSNFSLATFLLNITTPDKLKLRLALSFVLATIFCIVTLVGVVQHHHASYTVGKETAPSVVAAHNIQIAVLNMDAAVSNALIAMPGANYTEIKVYEDWRHKVAEELIAAAKSMAYASEEKPIHDLQVGLLEYETTIQSARDLHEHDDAAYLAKYREAHDTLRTKILPATEALDNANTEILKSTYASQHTQSIVTLVLVNISGIALVAVLFFTRKFIADVFHRRFSFADVALALSATFLLYLNFSFIQQDRHLKAATKEAFHSMEFIMDAHASALNANATGSRWLLDDALRAGHAEQFNQRIQDLAKFGNGYDFNRTEAEAKDKRAKLSNSSFSGFLAEALRDISFEGEHEAALDALHWLGVYVSINEKARALELAGKHKDAIALATGQDENQSNWAFTKLEKALDQAFSINQNEFDKDINKSLRDIAGLTVVTPVIAVLVALLTYLAIRPRLREYV